MFIELLQQTLLFVSSYITQNAFPQPLSEEEEAFYLQKMQEGDEEAKNMLIKHNLRLVAHIAKKFDSVAEDTDDLISIGTIGLIKGINTFNITKGAKLATYSARCVENEILMHLRAQKKRKCEVSINDPIGTDKEGNEISLLDILGTEANYVLDEVELKVQVGKLYEQLNKILTPREREIVQLRYGLTPYGYKTQREIAQKLDISRSYVSRIEKKALKKLEKELVQES